MESYIEITLIHHLFFMYITIEYASIIVCKYMKKSKMFRYCMFISVCGILSFNEYHYYIVLMSEFIGYYLYFRYNRNMYCVQLLLRIIVMMMMYLFYGGSIYNNIYFIDDRHYPYVFWIIEILSLIYIKSFKRFDMLLESMVYDVTLTINNKKKSYKLYLDTGNHLSYHHIPVIMIDQRFKDDFILANASFISMYTLSGFSSIEVYEGFICCFDNIDVSCYIHFCNIKHLKKDCHGLLNMKLMVR